MVDLPDPIKATGGLDFPHLKPLECGDQSGEGILVLRVFEPGFDVVEIRQHCLNLSGPNIPEVERLMIGKLSRVVGQRHGLWILNSIGADFARSDWAGDQWVHSPAVPPLSATVHRAMEIMEAEGGPSRIEWTPSADAGEEMHVRYGHRQAVLPPSEWLA